MICLINVNFLVLLKIVLVKKDICALLMFGIRFKWTKLGLSWSLFKDRCFAIGWCFWKSYYGLDPCHYFSSTGLS